MKLPDRFGQPEGGVVPMEHHKNSPLNPIFFFSKHSNSRGGRKACTPPTHPLQTAEDRCRLSQNQREISQRQTIGLPCNRVQNHPGPSPSTDNTGPPHNTNIPRTKSTRNAKLRTSGQHPRAEVRQTPQCLHPYPSPRRTPKPDPPSSG